MPAPFFASTLDGMIPVGNPAINDAAVSTSVTVQRGYETGTANHGARSPVLPLRTSGSAGCAIRKKDQTYSRPSFVLISNTGVDLIRVQQVNPAAASDDIVLQYWNGSSWITVGASFNMGSDVNHFRIDWSGYGTSSGSITMRAFKDAAEEVIAERSVTGINFSALPGIAQVFAGCPVGGSSTIFSAIFVSDSGGDTSYVYNNVANANGADVGGTGDFNSVSNTSGSTYDSTFVSLNTAGLRRSFRNTAARNYDNRGVRAVSISARLRRGTTGPTRATLYLTIGGTRYYHPNVQLLATSFESYTFVWETNPATGAPWLASEVQAASLEWGVEAVA